jgi:hypothetical protein
MTQARRRVVIGGYGSSAVGLLLMAFLPWSVLVLGWTFYLFWVPLAAALVVSVVALAQKRLWPGIALLVVTVGGTAGVWSARFGVSLQQSDRLFRPRIAQQAYAAGEGPVVLIDEAHNNFHTATGRYLPFAELLRRDGYVVRASEVRFTEEMLRTARLLVIANARRPAEEPAFTDDEVAAVRDWVATGGSLLLIADHPPFVEAARQLGATFGIRYLNASAVWEANPGPITFRRADGTLRDHPLTQGIDHVMIFGGSSFELDPPGEPLLVFGPEIFSRPPAGADIDRGPLEGHLQGAVLPFGQGKVAALAEAAMFSAQVYGRLRTPMGMNHRGARQNAQFLLNVIHWLTNASAT